MTATDDTLAPGTQRTDPSANELAGSPLDLMPATSDAVASGTGDWLMDLISRKPMTALLASMAAGACTMALVARSFRPAPLPAHGSTPEPVRRPKPIWPSIAASILGAWLSSRSGRNA